MNRSVLRSVRLRLGVSRGRRVVSLMLILSCLVFGLRLLILVLLFRRRLVV